MFKLISVLAAAMFLTLLIGGEDRGQKRFGLADVAQNPAERPVLRPTTANTSTAKADSTEADSNVVLANFSPVTVQQQATVTPPRSTSVIAGKFVVEKPAATEEPAPATALVAETASALPVMYINSRSVNVRQGPSTDYDVVGRLSRAEAVSVISPEEDGWVRISIEGDGLEGFIAARLLTETDPANN